MKYHIITEYGDYQIEAEDFEDALNQVYRGVKETEMNDMWYKSSKKHKCEDCIHCDIKAMKCYPQSRDCHSEYDLTEEDLHNLCLCDFFKHK